MELLDLEKVDGRLTAMAGSVVLVQTLRDGLTVKQARRRLNEHIVSIRARDRR